ncbi:MAG: pyrroloquinoline quinone biosynthesis protein PqqB [Acidobacteria bacterium 13_1_20CM_2_60_10]|nr:MAG: pyrroloquinoline quinone biosynthesis protein PqqB [Acidobacteria bacterium 13_1_20CM_2_60_10]
MKVKVLGSAAGGGFPQWNCGCSNCSRLRRGVFRGKARTQAQLAVSPDDATWFLLNTSPDLRQQFLAHPEFAPSEKSRNTPVAAIVLTSADVDCVLGLLHLREFQPLRIYSTLAVKRALTEENRLFQTLTRSNPPVRWEPLPLDRLVPLFQPAGPVKKTSLFCKAVSLNGAYPDYLSDALRRALSEDEAVIALQLVQSEKSFFYAPSLPGCGEDWKRRVSESHLALLDGTFWTDDELPKVQSGSKTARQMGHLPVSGSSGLLDQLKLVRNPRRVLIHLNNTNPILDEESDAHRAVRDAGWEVAYDGMEFAL